MTRVTHRDIIKIQYRYNKDIIIISLYYISMGSPRKCLAKSWKTPGTSLQNRSTQRKLHFHCCIAVYVSFPSCACSCCSTYKEKLYGNASI